MRTLTTSQLTTRAEALGLGWTDSALRRAVLAGRVQRVRPGLFVAGGARIDHRLAAVAANRSCRGSVVSHLSAAIMHGLPVLREPARPAVTVLPRKTGDVAGAQLHRAGLTRADVVTIDGVPVTSVARTLVDVPRSSPTAAAVVPADAALHRELVSQTDLDLVVRSCTSWPGIRRATRTLTLTDPNAESPLESVSRLVLRWLGLPRPRAQVRVCHDDGTLIGRVDFYWDEFGVFGEADGATKYDTRSVLIAEKRRHEALEDQGLVGVRWGWYDVTRRPRALRTRVERAFARGRARDLAALPRNWSIRVA